VADTRETMRVEVSGSDLAGDYVLDERLDDGSLVLRPEHPGEGQRYTAVLSRGEDGIVCAQVVEAPEAISQGLTPEEAKANVSEALELALEWRRAEGEAVPKPTQVSLLSLGVETPTS